MAISLHLLSPKRLVISLFGSGPKDAFVPLHEIFILYAHKKGFRHRDPSGFRWRAVTLACWAVGAVMFITLLSNEIALSSIGEPISLVDKGVRGAVPCAPRTGSGPGVVRHLGTVLDMRTCSRT